MSHSSGKLQIPSMVPASIIFPAEGSKREFIRSRTTYEFLADSQVQYSYTGNSRITFTLNDPTMWLDSLESYISFKLTTALTDTGAAAVASSRYLCPGGVHSLFRNVELRLANGTLLERIESYNQLYAISSFAIHSQDHVNHVEKASGDSVNEYEVDMSFISNPAVVAGGGGGTLNYVHATRVLTLGANVAADFQIGDVLLFNGNIVLKVLGIHTAGALIVSGGFADVGVNANNTLQIIGRGVQGSRAIAARTAACTISLRLMSGLLNQHRWLPLPMLRNLQIILELERPEFVMVTDIAPSGANVMSASYAIDNPRYVASLCDIDPAYQQELFKMSKEMPMLLNWQSYRHTVATVSAAGSVALTINANVRSARAVVFAITTNRSETVSNVANANRNTFNYESIGTFPKAGLERWQVKVGGRSFPDQAVVVDALGNTTWTEVLKAIGLHNHSAAESRVTPRQWQSINTVSGVPNESSVFFGAVRLDGDGYLSGISLENQNLQLEMTFAAIGDYDPAQLGRTIHAWVIYDATAELSQTNGVRVYS